MNSNYRKFYLKDKEFYLTVLDSEEPGENGFEFKINLFKVSPNEIDTNSVEKSVF